MKQFKVYISRVMLGCKETSLTSEGVIFLAILDPINSDPSAGLSDGACAVTPNNAEVATERKTSYHLASCNSLNRQKKIIIDGW